MAKMKDWLADFAAARDEQNKKRMKRTASAKQPARRATKKSVKASAGDVEKAQVLIMSRETLPKAVNGNTVRYNGAKWRVVNAAYKDALGPGIALERVAAIDTKNLTDPPTRAYTDPGDVYDYDVRDVSEIPDFQEAAARTEQEILRDRAHDITTPAGRVTNPEPVVNVFDDIAEEVVEVEEPAVEEPAAEEPVAEEPAAEEPAAEEPVAEDSDNVEDSDDVESSDGVENFDGVDNLDDEESEDDEEPKLAAKKSIYKTNPILRKIVANADKEDEGCDGAECNCGDTNNCTASKNPILAKIFASK